MIMKNINWFFSALIAIVLCACAQHEMLEEDAPQSVPDGMVSITAYAPGDGADSRIAFIDNGSTISLEWSDEESISVIWNNGNETFTKSSEGNVFTGNSLGESEVYYASYPTTTSTDYTTVPYDLSSQTGMLEGGQPYMYATSTDGESFSFAHSTALLKATFSGLADGTAIKWVMLTTKGCNKMKGSFNLTDGSINDGSTGNHITVYFDTPVSSTTPVFVYLPPMASDEKELFFDVMTSDNKCYTATLDGSSGKAILAGNLYTAENISLTPDVPYVTFSTTGTQVLTIGGASDADLNVEYSLGGDDWYNLTVNEEILFGRNDGFLRLRGMDPYGTNEANISFANESAPVECHGDIRTLVDYENYADAETDNANFKGLFKGCVVLTTAPELPAKKLNEGCYEYMFLGCTSLTTAPELPAEIMEFACYAEMFSGCTSLQNAPELPATTLAYGCYDHMFYGCASLVSAPELPATTLVENCYYKMFYDCVKLKYIKMLAKDVSAYNCLYNWVTNVSQTGTFIKARSMTSLPSGSNGIPTNWTVENQ